MTVYLPIAKPTTRAECANVPRPCPWVSCYYHLAILRVCEGSHSRGPRGPKLRLSPYVVDDDLDDMPETCVLDVAEDGEHTLDDIAKMLGVTSERVRQIESRAMFKLKLLHHTSKRGMLPL